MTSHDRTPDTTPASADEAHARTGQDTKPAPGITVVERTGIPADARGEVGAAALDVAGETVDDDRLVAVMDGPYAGQWFTLTDWRARLDAARYMAQATGTRSPVLDYLPGPDSVPHPYLHEVDGIPAHYTPAHHQAQDRTAVPAADRTEDPAACRPRAVGIEPDTDVA
jgi:hypothetical protein